MGVLVHVKEDKLFVSSPEDVASLRKGFYGNQERSVIFITPEEAMYLLDIRNATAIDEKGHPLHYNDIATRFEVDLTRYFAFRAWRERGLIIRPASEVQQGYGRSPIKKYPSGRLEPCDLVIRGTFYKESLMSVVEDMEVGRYLYEHYWLGQAGTYKASHKGKVTTFDVFETLFLVTHFNASFEGATRESILHEARRRRPDFDHLYEVYEDWRLRGYLLKTGYKFGTHFRLYFPGASPKREEGEWMHSKHVIHAFPREAVLLISEWSRAIRVAHSVRKTFILAIPGKEVSGEGLKADFLLYHRKGGGIETPESGKPSFLMLALNEEEFLGGQQLAQAIATAKERGLDLMLAIVDRETSVTFYRVKRIELPGSKNEYYEIEWAQP